MENKNLTGYPSIDKPWLKYYSEEAINAKLPECTIYKYLWQNNKDHLNDTALNYFDRKITYGEMFVNIKKAAKAFSALGVKEGDIVVMTTVTTPETIYAFYGLNRLGAISNMVDPRTSEEGIRDYIKEVDAKFVLTIDVALPKIRKAIVGTGVKEVTVVSPADSLSQSKKTVFLLSNKIKGETPKLFKRCIRWKDFIEQGKNEKPVYSRYKKDSCCVIVHTGGTTGSPKGVMLSNDNVNAGALQAQVSPLPLKRNDKFLNIMPPFIAYGLVLGIHVPFTSGWESLLIPVFKPEEFSKLMLKHKPNAVMGVPAYYEYLIADMKMNKADLSHIKVALVGGDKTDIEFENKINTYFIEHGCNISLSKGYSMTEASSMATISFEKANLVGSNGVPLSMTVISAFDTDNNQELKYGEQGELCFKTPTMMLGYYENAEETDTIKKKHKDGSVWLHSGDIGYVDENGLVYVIGRIKRIIVRHDGFKVFPIMIEEAVEKSAFISSCCAVGVADPDHIQGKLPIVYAVLAYNANKSTVKAELRKLCESELPEYAQPVDFRFIESMPLTPIGKVDYRALEKMAEEGL